MVFRGQYRKFKQTVEPPTGPSITDKLMHEELKDIIQRFFVAGGIPQSGIPADLEVTSKTTVEDIDRAFDEFETAEVANMDRVERFEAMTHAQDLLARVDRLSKFKQAQEKAKKPLEQPKDAPADIVEGVS